MKKLFSLFMAGLLIVPLLAETYTVTKQVSEVAAEQSWVPSTDADNHSYVKFQLDKVVSVSCKAANNGVYWENTTDATKSDWRMYQARELGEFNISTAVGYQLKSITLTYGNKNTGVVALVQGSSVATDKQVKSGTKLSLYPRTFSQTLYVSNSSTPTNGQARITKFSVEYESVPVDTLYLNTGGSDLWNQGGAKFSVWYWNDGEQGHFTPFLELAYGETDIYRAIIPKSDSVIFVRHDAAADVPTWENKWNQTNSDEVDLEIGNIMVITGWQPADREWDYYTPKEEKYYVTGDSILLGDANKWNPAAIELVNGTYTFEGLTPENYKMKVTDGTWNKSWGFANLEESHDAGLSTDADGNICFTLEETGDVTVTKNGDELSVTGVFKQPCETNYGIMVGTTFVPGVYDTIGAQWVVKGQVLMSGAAISLYSLCDETAFAPVQGDFANYFYVEGTQLTAIATAQYDFYIKPSFGNDELWVVKHTEMALPRITKAPQSWAGEYAITMMTNDTALVWTGVDAGMCRDSIKLKNDTLRAYQPVRVKIEAMEAGGYSVKVIGGDNDGKYISSGTSAPSYSNALKFVDSPVRVDIEMVSGLVEMSQTINEQKVYFLYNKASGDKNERFRFYKDINYGGANYKTLTLFGTPDPVITYDTTMYVAGNFTNWADNMQELPYTVTLPKDSVLAFKQVRVIATMADSVVTNLDSTWMGQTTENFYMDRTNVGEGWTLDGEYNVLLRTDAAGDYTFSLNGESFKVTFPALDEKVYFKGFSYQWTDTAMQITDDTIATLTLHHDAVMVDSFVIHKGDTYWKIDASAIDMNRDNCTDWGVTTLTENVKDITIQIDKAGDYTYVLDMKNNKLSVTYPEAVIVFDTAMYVAGDFTNWEAGMQKLPYTANLPQDSTIEFKQVRQVIKYFDAIPVDTTLTWYGTPGTDPMTRDNSTWLLDGENNVTLTTDVAGDYKFEIIAATGEMQVTWPEKPGTNLDIVMMNEQVSKVVVNGQLYIIRNNVLYNATGARVK